VIDVAFTPEEARALPLARTSAVVIDAVRASTTIVAALASGARAVLPVATVEEARRRAASWRDARVLLGGERDGEPPAGFECGNSPAEYTADRVRGRTVVFTTTNGTRALVAVRAASAVAVGGFVNANAVAAWLTSRPGDWVLVCAGEKGRFCLEDAACAGLLVGRLQALTTGRSLSDAARAALTVWEHYRDDPRRLLAEATWARTLAERGRGPDLALCLTLDAFDVVPVTLDGALVAGAAAGSALRHRSSSELTLPEGARHNDPILPTGGGDA